MAVRNFYVEADIDGRQTTLGGGPRSKDGEMSVTIYQRNGGSIDTAVNVYCKVKEVDGKTILVTEVYTKDSDGKTVVQKYETER